MRPGWSDAALVRMRPVEGRRGQESDQDWRLEAELEVADSAGALGGLISRLRGSETGSDVAEEAREEAPADVVITHDGRLLYAYAADEATLGVARRAVEGVLARDGVKARVRVSRWHDEMGEWLQTDPPPDVGERAEVEHAKRDAETPETRTLVASSGRLVRGEFEQTMRNWAAELGLECEVIEHPHLLSTQVAFTVSGPHHRVQEFASGLRAEEWATIRAQLPVVTSPL